MKIDTTLETLDECYFMYDNKVHTGTIKDIQISVVPDTLFGGKVDKIYIKYSVEFKFEESNERMFILEDNVFPTKQELLDSL